MHVYKSSTPQRLLTLQHQHHPESKAVSLQTDEAKAHEELGLTPARPEWSATLQSIGQCKAVISVDTAVAHLAAGSGKPCSSAAGQSTRLAMATYSRGSIRSTVVPQYFHRDIATIDHKSE